MEVADTTSEVEELEDGSVSETDSLAEAAEANEGESDETGADAGDEAETVGTETDEAEGSEHERGVKGLTAEQQAAFDRAIGRKVAKLRTAEEALETTAAERDELKGRLDALEARDATEAVKLGVHPDYLAKDELAVLQRYDALSGDETFLTDHLDDGVPARGNQPELSPQEVRQRLRQVTQELRTLAPRAEGLKQERVKQMLADMRAGREARLKRGSGESGNRGSGSSTQSAQSSQSGQKPASAAVPKPKVVPNPPVAAGRSAGAAPVARPGQAKPRAVFSTDALEKKGGGTRALQSMYEDAG
jgi:hypothetical protein